MDSFNSSKLIKHFKYKQTMISQILLTSDRDARILAIRFHDAIKKKKRKNKQINGFFIFHLFRFFPES